MVQCLPLHGSLYISSSTYFKVASIMVTESVNLLYENAKNKFRPKKESKGLTMINNTGIKLQCLHCAVFTHQC